MPRFARTDLHTKAARALRLAASKSERKLWLYLRREGAGAAFRRQHPIGPYFADYACVSLKIVVEVDGEGHDLARDARRDAFMRAAGWHVLRFGAEDALRNPEGCFELICDAVRLLQAR